MKFIEPGKQYEEKAGEYIREFLDANSDINGAGSLDKYLDSEGYDAWLAFLETKCDDKQIAPGQVKASTYFWVRESDDQIIGMVNIRHGLNESLYREGGHIGYSIRPSERGKGYATQMLEQALWLCQLIGLDRVLAVCDKSNAASARVIKKCGGLLENEFYSDHYDEIIQRYWISNE